MQIVFCQAISIIANTLLLNKNSHTDKNSHTKLQYEQIKKEKQGKSNLETQKSIPYTNTNKITWLEKQITHHQASAPTLTRKHKYKTSEVEALYLMSRKDISLRVMFKTQGQVTRLHIWFKVQQLRLGQFPKLTKNLFFVLPTSSLPILNQ